jgi:hypothetical protein
MGVFFSKTFSKNTEGNIKLPNKEPEIYYQVSIKNSNNNNSTKKILKCLQVSDFVSRPINYKVGSKNTQAGGGFFNFLRSSKKNLFIFCCEDTFEAKMTLFFSWIKFIDPKLPILIINSATNNKSNKQKNLENFKFDSSEIKRLAYNSPNFSLKKIPLIFENYNNNIDSTSILEYFTQKYKLNLANYTGVYLVFVQNFPDKKECELLDSRQNPLFPGEWVDSEFVKNGIFKGANPLVDNLFLPDFDELSKINDLDKLRKIDGYLRFLMMHYSGNLGKIKNFKNVKLSDNYFFGYQNMRKILVEKIKNLKKTQQNPI